MARKFDLGAELRRAGVSNSDTVREQIEYLPLEKIDPDPRNFYSLGCIDELAENIETVGLQQPLRVRPGEHGRYTLISGHRRRVACMMIRDGGSEQFKQGVPCIVECGVCSPEMTELRLIFANSSTRVMSSAELSRQMARTEELLYELMSQGFEFKGRMREHVAAALNTSSSKIGRLHAIRARLCQELLEEFDAGRIGETAAYRLSREEGHVQRELAAKLGPAVRGLTADTLEQAIDKVKHPILREPEPEENSGDANQAIDRLKNYMEGRTAEDRKFWKLLNQMADPIICRSFRDGAVPLRRDNIDQLKTDLRTAGVWSKAEHWQGSNKGLAIGPNEAILRSWTEVYDALAAIAITRWRQVLVDERSRRGRQPAADMPTVGTAEAKWQTGTPPKTGYYAARLEFYGKPIASPRVLWWDKGIWYNAVGDNIRQHKIDAQIRVVGWWPLPER